MPSLRAQLRPGGFYRWQQLAHAGEQTKSCPGWLHLA